MKYLFLSICLFLNVKGFTQVPNDSKRDKTWVLGFGKLPSPMYGGFTLQFNNDQLSTTELDHPLNLSNDFSIMNDLDGNLLFFSGGTAVSDRFGNIMPHGDSLNYGEAWETANQGENGNYWVMNGLIILPKPGSPNLYYIIHERIIYGVPAIIDGLYFSIVDMSLNNELGDVTLKNQVLINDTLDWGGLTACRHSNGHDWWILVPADHGVSYYKILLDGEGLHVVGQQIIGNHGDLAYYENATATFSLDGNTYVRRGASDVYGPKRLDIFSFDRLNGNLGNYRNFWITDTSWNNGVEISANNRFLYYPIQYKLYQFDLQADDIGNSMQLIAEYDGFYWGGGTPTSFGFPRLAPDNKIYLSAGNSPYLHVINYPDSAGVGCNFLQHSVSMPHCGSVGLPNVPKYRTDIITSVDNKIRNESCELKLIPNPASEVVKIYLDNISKRPPAKIFIYTIDGRMLTCEMLDTNQTSIELNVSSYTQGVYFIYVTDSYGRVISKRKLNVIHI